MTKELTRDVEANVYFLTPEEGGRQSAASSDYKAGFRYPGEESQWVVAYQFLDCAHASLGQTTRTHIGFMSPSKHVGRLACGSKFEVCEGGKLVATGEITDILDLKKNAQREHEAHRSQNEASQLSGDS